MKNIIYLLKELNIIRNKYDMISEQKEQFNIFKILHNYSDERRLHSRFISSLLDTKGTHLKESFFLEKFLKVVECDLFSNLLNIEVFPKEKDKRERDNIDILVIDEKNRKALLIENKIYARDSNHEDRGQLEGYFEKIKNDYGIKSDNIGTFYLTLDGHEPSDESLGKYKTLDKINCKCISYDDHILRWISSCMSKVVENPYIRESLLQYKKLIEEMTNNATDVKQRLEIRDSICRNEDSMKSTKMLVENFKHVKWHTVRDFWNELGNCIVSRGYKIDTTSDDIINDNRITAITHYETYKKGNSNNQAGGLYFIVGDYEMFIYHFCDSPLVWGVYDNKVISNKFRNQIEKLKQNYSLKYSKSLKDVNTLLELQFFEDEDEKIILNNFEKDSTFNLLDKNCRKVVIEKMMKEIDDFINEMK